MTPGSIIIHRLKTVEVMSPAGNPKKRLAWKTTILYDLHAGADAPKNLAKSAVEIARRRRYLRRASTIVKITTWK